MTHQFVFRKTALVTGLGVKRRKAKLEKRTSSRSCCRGSCDCSQAQGSRPGKKSGCVSLKDCSNKLPKTGCYPTLQSHSSADQKFETEVLAGPCSPDPSLPLLASGIFQQSLVFHGSQAHPSIPKPSSACVYSCHLCSVRMSLCPNFPFLLQHCIRLRLTKDFILT